MVEIPSQNHEKERKLMDLILSGEAVLMVGAGSSMIVKYPSWGGLIKILEQEIRDSENANDFNFRPEYDNDEDDLVYASRLKSAMTNGRYQALIHQTFDDTKDCDDCHVKLVELPFRGIITTNYDVVLERALFKFNGQPSNSLVIDEGTANREIYKFFQALNFGYEGHKRITHLHGIYSQPPSIVLCIEDYIKRYGEVNLDSPIWPRLKRILWALVATRRIVYVGFSMSDPFFRLVNSIVSEDFGSWNYDTHFMITRLETNDEEEGNKQLKFAQKINKDYGIDTIFFEDDESFDGLRKYIIKLHDICINKNPAATPPSTIEPINKGVQNPVNDYSPRLRELMKQASRLKSKAIRDDDN